jgi:ACR3 family arsenite transporter
MHTVGSSSSSSWQGKQCRQHLTPACVCAGILLRSLLLKVKSKAWFEQRFMPYFGPCALLGLLYTTLIMFAAQDIISHIGNVARVAVPMFLYFNIMFAGSLAVSYALSMPYSFAVTQAFTAASNNFELAIAVAVGTFGIASQEALAATVGPLIEVPVLLGLVYVTLWARRKFWPQPVQDAGCGIRGI